MRGVEIIFVMCPTATKSNCSEVEWDWVLDWNAEMSSMLKSTCGGEQRKRWGIIVTLYTVLARKNLPSNHTLGDSLAYSCSSDSYGWHKSKSGRSHHQPIHRAFELLTSLKNVDLGACLSQWGRGILTGMCNNSELGPRVMGGIRCCSTNI